MIAAMKRNFSRFMFIAAAAMTFFGCQKPEVVAPEVAEDVMLTFASEKPAFDDATKTEWTGETIQWSAGDKISIAYTVDGNWQNASGNASGDAKLYKSEPLVKAMETAQFDVSASFNGEIEGTHVFYGVYPAPSETGFANAPVAMLTVAPSQNPKADSFDSNGDLMLGVSDVHTARPTDDETISMRWERMVAHAVITLTNINGLTSEEILEAITLTAQADANLVGKQKVNLLTKEVTKDNDAANVLKVSANNLTAVERNVTFWACMLPETVTSLTVEVATDKATYTREIKDINVEFKQNARNLLSIKMGEAVRVAKTVNENEVVDVLNNALIGITGSTYTSWTGKTSVSDAVYAGQSAGGNESIQLRSNNNNSGVVTTVSGGFAKKVVLTWNSNTANGRTLNVYGSNSAYSATTDLYDDAKAGTKLGTIVCGTSTELIINGDYKYIGLRSNSGAMYIEEIKITWLTGSSEGGEPVDPTPEPEEPATPTVVTIAEFKALADGETIYEVEGRILKIETAYNSQYNNISFYIVDESTDDSMQIYRMSCEGVTDPANSITVGDKIIVQGAKGSYGGQAQMAQGGVYISHEDGANTPVIVCADNTVTITADSGAAIYYTTNGETPTINSNIYNAGFTITETATVKAIAVETGKLTSLVASTECEYVDPNSAQTKVTEVLEIIANKGVLASGSGSISWTGINFTCTNIKGSTAIRTSDSDHYRVYQNSTLKLTATEKSFTKVVVTCTSSEYANVLKTSATNGGYTASVSGSVVTITCAPAVSEISMKASAQFRINKVEATLQ